MYSIKNILYYHANLLKLINLFSSGFCRCWCQPTRRQARRRGPTCPRWGPWGCSGRSNSCPESQVGYLFFWTRKLSKNRNSLDTLSLCQRRKTFDKDLDTIYDSSQTSISRSPDRNSMSPLSGGTQFTSLVEVYYLSATVCLLSMNEHIFISNTCSISCPWGETLSLLFSRNRRLAMLTIFYGRPGNSISSHELSSPGIITHPSVCVTGAVLCPIHTQPV